MTEFFYLLATTVEGGWKPGIGDPTFLGWFTVVAYLVGALVCWKAASVAREIRSGSYWRGEALFWVLFAVFLFAFGINKQLDLQTWFTTIGKQVARATGWYEQRRVVQFAFVALIVLFGFVVSVLGLWWTRRLPISYRIAVAGGIFLAAFIVIRASSFHHIDQFLGFRIGGLRMNVLLEVGGIACITAAAWQICRRKRLQNPATVGNLRGFKIYG